MLESSAEFTKYLWENNIFYTESESKNETDFTTRIFFCKFYDLIEN
jgi:hypothetical protein